MYTKDVTKTNPNRPSRRVSDVGHDKRTFSATADKSHEINLRRRAPMRGGIRL